MRRPFSNCLQIYLVACLVLAGFAGLNPVLHLLLDHGGRGAVHSHWRAVPAHTHDGQRWHSHETGGAAVPSKQPVALRQWLFVHERQQPGPAEAWGWLSRQLGRWFGTSSDLPPAEEGAPLEHEHRGLSAMLLNGLVDASASVIAVPLRPDFPPCTLSLWGAPVRCVPWLGSAPTRGPPCACSAVTFEG